MTRIVTADLDLAANGPADLILGVAVAAGEAVREESLEVDPAPAGGIAEFRDATGTRLHRLRVSEGSLRVRYRAVVDGERAVHGPDGGEPDEILHLRPSRYCPSDVLFGTLGGRFDGLAGVGLVDAVVDDIRSRLEYVPGHSSPTDGALETLAAGRGVCRDYAHAAIATLRALEVPARYVACYAPGLEPMDFHALVEARVDGDWILRDVTGLADPGGVVRIGTGRDAADCAFLTSHGADVRVQSVVVDARQQDPVANVG